MWTRPDDSIVKSVCVCESPTYSLRKVVMSLGSVLESK